MLSTGSCDARQARCRNVSNVRRNKFKYRNRALGGFIEAKQMILRMFSTRSLGGHKWLGLHPDSVNLRVVGLAGSNSEPSTVPIPDGIEHNSGREDVLVLNFGPKRSEKARWLRLLRFARCTPSAPPSC